MVWNMEFGDFVCYLVGGGVVCFFYVYELFLVVFYGFFVGGDGKF